MLNNLVDEHQTAIDLKNYLGIENLPKYFVDDIRDDIDSELMSDDEVLMRHFKEDSLYGIKTVRFLKDYYHYRAKPDITTTNISFKRTSEIFRRQGILNYYFILQLNNPLLLGVNPRDEDNLTNEQKTWIMNECKENFWYFLREVCYLKDGVQFQANRGNVSFIWTYLNHITTYNIMPRQQGKALDEDTKIRVKVPKDILGNFNAWKKIKDLATGDTIISPDGSEALVNGLHYVGKKRLYRFTMSDGREVKACTEHMWRYRTNKDCGENSWSETTTAHLLNMLKEEDYDKDRVEIPLIKPLENTDKLHCNYSYFSGCLLSGVNDNGEIHLHNVDTDKFDILKEHVNPDYHKFSISHNHVVLSHATHQLKNIDYTVPYGMEECSIETRLLFLQGVLDNLGVVGDKGIELSLRNRSTLGQIQYIVRSLGGTALLNQRNDMLTITLPEELNYFKFRKEVDVPIYENKLYIDKITYSGMKNAVCIEVNNDDSTYITENFIVTHNTVSVQVIDFWLTYIMGRSYKTHLITLKSDNRAQFIEAIKNIRTQMPKYLVNPTYKDKDSGTYLTYRSFGEGKANVLTISVPQQSESAAGDLGRGLTVGTTNFDEPGYINYIQSIVDGCAPSSLTEMKTMRERGLPYGINYITTPNTVKHPSGEYMYKHVMESTEWREKFFDCYSESHLVYKLIKRAPQGVKDIRTASPSISMVYNYLKLGKNKNWVAKTINDLKLSLSKAKIDLLLMWVEDGEDRLFDDITREALSENKRDAVWSKEYSDSNLYIDFFITKEELQERCKASYNDFFLIGCDTSSAINKDACTVVIRSMVTGDVIGVGRYPLAFLDEVGDIIIDLLESVNNSMLVIERNYAHHMIDKLLVTMWSKGMDPFKKIFNYIFEDPIANAKEYEEVRKTRAGSRTKEFYLRYKKSFGFITSQGSRKELYGLIKEAVGITGAGINYEKLIDEIIGLKIKNDRIDHATDGHDDLVIAWLLTYWFIKRGKSKSDYGIPPGIQLTRTRNLMNNKTETILDDPQVIELLDRIRKQIAKLTEEYIKTNDNILAMRLEYEINKLLKLIPKDGKKVITIDTTLEQAKIERSQRLMKHRKAA